MLSADVFSTAEFELIKLIAMLSDKTIESLADSSVENVKLSKRVVLSETALSTVNVCTSEKPTTFVFEALVSFVNASTVAASSSVNVSVKALLNVATRLNVSLIDKLSAAGLLSARAADSKIETESALATSSANAVTSLNDNVSATPLSTASTLTSANVYASEKSRSIISKMSTTSLNESDPLCLS